LNTLTGQYIRVTDISSSISSRQREKFRKAFLAQIAK